MAYTISGSYVAACDCALLCGCPVDAPPTGANGTCTGALVFSVDRGSLEETDLGGVKFALYNYFPSNLTAGNWKVGIVIDSAASEEQAAAVGRIISGEEGGPFADFAPLIGEMLGTERADIAFDPGDSPSASVGDRTQISMEPSRGVDGTPTMVRGAMFGFAPEYTVGKGSGHSDAFGLSFDGRYAEAAEFQFASDSEGQARGRA